MNTPQSPTENISVNDAPSIQHHEDQHQQQQHEKLSPLLSAPFSPSPNCVAGEKMLSQHYHHPPQKWRKSLPIYCDINNNNKNKEDTRPATTCYLLQPLSSSSGSTTTTAGQKSTTLSRRVTFLLPSPMVAAGLLSTEQVPTSNGNESDKCGGGGDYNYSDESTCATEADSSKNHLWWTKPQILDFYRQARRTARGVIAASRSSRSSSGSGHDLPSSLEQLYQQAAVPNVPSSALLRGPVANHFVQHYCHGDNGDNDNDDTTTRRGLEPFLHPIVKESRAAHVQGVLCIQKALQKVVVQQEEQQLHGCCQEKSTTTMSTTRLHDDACHRSSSSSSTTTTDTTHSDSPDLPPPQMQQHKEILRTRSLQTSRAARVVARLLAHADTLQVTKLLQEELDEQMNNSINGRSKMQEAAGSQNNNIGNRSSSFPSSLFLASCTREKERPRVLSSSSSLSPPRSNAVGSIMGSSSSSSSSLLLLPTRAN